MPFRLLKLQKSLFLTFQKSSSTFSITLWHLDYIVVQNWFLNLETRFQPQILISISYFLLSEPNNLTKQEIRTLEGKLIKHFSEQLAIKAALSAQKDKDVSCISQYPKLSQWLKVVGVTKESAQAIERSVSSLDALKEKSDSELNRFLLQVSNLISRKICLKVPKLISVLF